MATLTLSNSCLVASKFKHIRQFLQSSAEAVIRESLSSFISILDNKMINLGQKPNTDEVSAVRLPWMNDGTIFRCFERGKADKLIRRVRDAHHQ